jgi:hypothetical protein
MQPGGHYNNINYLLASLCRRATVGQRLCRVRQPNHLVGSSLLKRTKGVLNKAGPNPQHNVALLSFNNWVSLLPLTLIILLDYSIYVY